MFNEYIFSYDDNDEEVVLPEEEDLDDDSDNDYGDIEPEEE